MSGLDQAHELVEAEKRRHPGAVELATLISLAVHVESELLRSMRLAVAPRLDAAVEADLWFGPLVRLRGPDGITLHPDVVEVLRDRLKEQWQNPGQRYLVERAWQVTRRVHQDTSPALVLEERVAWLALSGDLPAAEAELDRALKALATGSRPGIAGWFTQAWSRMPTELRGTRSGWLLHHASGRPGPPRIRPTGIPGDLLAHDLSLALTAVGDVKLGVRRRGDLLELGDTGAGGAAAILVPETDPRIVEIRWPDEPTAHAEVVSVAPGQTVGRTVGTGRLQLRTARGTLYELTMDRPRRFFVAAGTARYRYDLPSLPLVSQDTGRMTELFARLGYEHVLPELSHDPTQAQLLAGLEQWLSDPARRPSDVVILYLAGHSNVHQGRHYLFTADSRPDRLLTTAIAMADIGRMLADSTVERPLVILDSDYAQQGAEDVMLEGRDRELWAIASAGSRQEAEDGAFVDALLAAVEDERLAGPRQPYLALDALVDAVNQRLAAGGHRQAAHMLASSGADVGPFVPNPRYDLAVLRDIDLEAQYRLLRQDFNQHWDPRARGVQFESERGWFFTGRTQALRELVAFLAATEPGADHRPRVVTGGPGSGKSAVLGRLVTLADPTYRRVVPFSSSPSDTVPPSGIIDVAIHARGKGLGEVEATLAAAIGIPDPARLLAVVTDRKAPLVVFLDALDEARDPRRIARELLRPLAAMPDVRLVVGTRRTLLDEIDLDAVVLDLDTPAYLNSADLAGYVRRILLAHDDSPGVTPYRESPELAAQVADAVAEQAFPSFLLAHLTAQALAAQPAPIDVTAAGWQKRLSATVGAALDEDLARFGAEERRARSLLTPLAYAEGAGLPRDGDLWAALATALARELRIDADVAWVLEHAGTYLVEGIEHGLPTYRLFHPALADHLRSQAGEQEAQRRITESLVERVPRAPDGTRTWQAAHPYIRSHLATHAAAAGMLAVLLEDPEFLLMADPEPLREARARMAETAIPTAPPMHLVPDVDYDSVVISGSAGNVGPKELGMLLSQLWSEAYRSQIPACSLLEFDSDGATFLFDLASAVDAEQTDRTVAAWGRSRRAPHPRDESYQRGYPSPQGRAIRLLDKGHMVAHAAGGTFGPNIFPQDRELNRGWSVEGRRYRALEREIANTPGTFFFCCLLYADDTDFPAAIELGVLRPDRLQVERFRNRFDL